MPLAWIGFSVLTAITFILFVTLYHKTKHVKVYSTLFLLLVLASFFFIIYGVARFNLFPNELIIREYAELLAFIFIVLFSYVYVAKVK